VSNGAGSDSEVKTGYITVTSPVPPVANFTADVTSGDAPLTVNFTDASTDAERWSWDFNGNGIEDSNETNPQFTYTDAGTYNVSLTVSNGAGSDSEVKTGYITVTSAPVPPVADFTADRGSGVSPLIVQFTDMSTNAVSWLWDFGDGNTSTDQDPTYTYSNVGVYSVNLTVSNSDGSDSEVKSDYITVAEYKPEEVNSSLSLGNTTINETTRGIQINNSSGNVDIIDNTTIKINNNNLDLYIHTDGITTEGNTSTGNYTQVTLDKHAEVSDLGGYLNNVSTSFNATLSDNISRLLQGNASITTKVVRELNNTNQKLFQLAAEDFAENMQIAYSLEIEKQNLTGVGIKDAYITMTAPVTYVESNGGPERFVVMSLHDGEVTKLETTYTISGGFYIFTAYSPDGFSIKSLVSYTPKEDTGSSGSSSSGGTSTLKIISNEKEPTPPEEEQQPPEEEVKPPEDTPKEPSGSEGTGTESNVSSPSGNAGDTGIPGFEALFAVIGLLSALYVRKAGEE
jgi:PGF-CTERM protein